jgi:hypothetical protein
MEKKMIEKKVSKEMFVENCPICGKEITGYSEAQVNQRMKIHSQLHNE